MLCPSWMAWMAASWTGAGTGVSQTPWARLMPPAWSQRVVMARISDCMVPGASWLRVRREEAEARVLGTGRVLYGYILHTGAFQAEWMVGA